MPKPAPQARKRKAGWWERQESITKLVIECMSAVIVVLIVAVVLVAILGNRGGNSLASASSTTLASAGQSGSTTTVASSASTTTRSTTGTTTATGSTTTGTTAAGSSTTTATAAPTSSTTPATATADTADHAADYRGQHPSTESFTNSNWATLDQSPGSHLGAAVDVTGQVVGSATIDPDTGYLNWHLSIPVAGGKEVQALCRTNVTLDRSLLSAGDWVQVRGVAVGAQTAAGSSGATVYVETIQRAAPLATTGT